MIAIVCYYIQKFRRGELLITVEHEFFLVGVHQSPSAFPLYYLLVLLKVPALRLIKGHEKQCELPRVY